ncbi:MAG: hypothetical protein H0X13_19935 [Ramlibacter sp.]|nr:hypothetical protein [Ramlibacter sp.]
MFIITRKTLAKFTANQKLQALKLAQAVQEKEVQQTTRPELKQWQPKSDSQSFEVSDKARASNDATIRRVK